MNRNLTRSSCLLMGLTLLACGREPVDTSAPPATTTSTPKSRPTSAPRLSPSPRPNATSASFIIPVDGVRAEQLRDTFNEARSEGRVHEAIDILAPHETRVVAAADGKIVKLFTSEKGGITIYQLSRDQSLVMYYAHLDRYADRIAEQQEVRQGEVLGYVGDTGNAQPGNYHLHFAVWQITDPKQFWDGTNLNPYELLRR